MQISNKEVEPYVGGRIEVYGPSSGDNYSGTINSLEVITKHSTLTLQIAFQIQSEGVEVACTMDLRLRGLEATVEGPQNNLILRPLGASDDIYLIRPE